MTLEILTSDLLAPLRHGFFTRRGGASSGIFNALNCGRGSSDQADIVSINLERVAKAMAVAPGDLVSMNQTHSVDVTVVEAPFDVPPRFVVIGAGKASARMAEAVEAVYAETGHALAHGDYVNALAHLARLRPQVDAFFDTVMVNADDEKIRANRLALLQRLADRLGSVAAIEHLSV